MIFLLFLRKFNFQWHPLDGIISLFLRPPCLWLRWKQKAKVELELQISQLFTSFLLSLFAPFFFSFLCHSWLQIFWYCFYINSFINVALLQMCDGILRWATRWLKNFVVALKFSISFYRLNNFYDICLHLIEDYYF